MAKNGYINTVRGSILPEELGLTLPHEHLFTDLRGPMVSNYAAADAEHVVQVIVPFLEEISVLGVTALVECSTTGVGRNPEILNIIAEKTPIHIIAPTGVYREAYVPQELREKSAQEISDIWVSDLTIGIEGSGIKAGFIKMAVSDEGISDIEKKNLEAAVLTSLRTGAVIASHTIGEENARAEMELLESFGLNLTKFIWTHAQSGSNPNFLIQAAHRGVILSIDAIGSGWLPDEDMLEYTLALISAGYSDKILLSHDAGWYDPSQHDGHPEGGGIRGYTDLFKSFLPELRNRGVNEEIIEQITIINPAKAFTLSV
jgi:phosphotriesterase-related protein